VLEIGEALSAQLSAACSNAQYSLEGRPQQRPRYHWGAYRMGGDGEERETRVEQSVYIGGSGKIELIDSVLLILTGGQKEMGL